MTPERWEQIKGLFHEALEHDPADRATFLVHVCCADASLREQVEALIASHEQAGDFIETNQMSPRPCLYSTSPD